MRTDAPARDRLDVQLDFLRWLHILWAAFNGIIGIGMAMYAGSAAMLAGAPGAILPGRDVAAGVTAAGFLIVAVTALVWAGAHAWCARAIRTRDRWGRLASLALASFNVLLVPFGTIFAGYTLWLLLQDRARQAFEVS
jgi:hypothetical protein